MTWTRVDMEILFECSDSAIIKFTYKKTYSNKDNRQTEEKFH